MPFRAVLFDWHGTLVRGEALDLATTAVTVATFLGERHGIALSPDDFERAFRDVLPDYSPGETLASPAIVELLPLALARLECRVAASDLAGCVRVFFDCCTAGETLFDDARALLASLRYRGYRTAIVTNSIFPEALFQAKAMQLGIAGYLDTVVSSADDGLAKPHPAPFLRAIASLRVDPSEALFVGDSPATDIAGARNAGIEAILLARNGHHSPDRRTTISRLSALNALLGEGPVEQAGFSRPPL